MKRFIPFLAVATLATASLGASAQGLYGELGYTPLKLEGSVGGLGVTSKPSSARGIIGYELNDNLAVESMLSLGVRDSAVKVGGFNLGGKAEVDNMIGVFVKPKVHVGEGLEVFGRLGATRAKLSIGSENASDTSIAYGLGASYHINSQLSLNADYMTYHDKDDITLKGFTVGVGYKF